MPETAKKQQKRNGFRVNEHIVYPTHGVGRIVDISTEEIVGTRLDFFVIRFDSEKMTLRIPVNKASSVGMRKVSDRKTVSQIYETVRGKARVKRAMWSRRAHEYEAKTNSGDVLTVAEVVRDLFRADRQSEQSFSERQLYEAALERVARELAVAENVSVTEAVSRLETAMTDSPLRAPKSRKSSTSKVLAADETQIMPVDEAAAAKKEKRAA